MIFAGQLYSNRFLRDSQFQEESVFKSRYPNINKTDLDIPAPKTPKTLWYLLEEKLPGVSHGLFNVDAQLQSTVEFGDDFVGASPISSKFVKSSQFLIKEQTFPTKIHHF